MSSTEKLEEQKDEIEDLRESFDKAIQQLWACESSSAAPSCGAQLTVLTSATIRDALPSVRSLIAFVLSSLAECCSFSVKPAGDPECTLQQYWARLEVSWPFLRQTSFVLILGLLSQARVDSLDVVAGEVPGQHGEGARAVERGDEGRIRQQGTQVARVLQPRKVCSLRHICFGFDTL